MVSATDTSALSDLSGNIALVTGASRGIGAAVARRLAAAGARVAVHYNSARDAADSVVAELQGEAHEAFSADLSVPDACRDLAESVVDRMGAIDILVNNAGIFELHEITELDFEGWQMAWERTLQTNLIGPANLTYVVARHMAERGGGRIINVSSRGAFRGEPQAPAYGASKAGLNSFSQSMAQALAPHNIFVGVVAPGFIETDMAASHLEGASGDAIRAQSPLGRVGQPDEIARIVEFLAGDGIGFATGCIVDANGASYLRT